MEYRNMRGKSISVPHQSEQIAFIKKWVPIALRIVFGMILIIASMDKIIHPLQFARAVENYQLLGEQLSRWVAIWLPYLELATGVLLIAGLWIDAAVTLNGIMMTIFFIAVLQAYARELDISCGCFSAEGGTEINFDKLIYNFLLLAGSLYLMFPSFIQRKMS